MTAATEERITHLRVGDVPRTIDMSSAPVGTIITTGGTQYERAADGMWERTNARQYRYNPEDLTANQCRVESIPDGYVYRDRPLETVMQYKWRFRQHSLRGALNNGVSYDASLRAIRDMDADFTLFPMGHGVRLLAYPDVDLLPGNTVVTIGSPLAPTGFGVWTRVAGRWLKILGENNNPPRESRGGCVVYSINNDRSTPEWVKAVGTDEDTPLILEFKATAWRRGWQLKQEQSWCGTYENVMRQFGLTRDAVRQVRGIGIGTRVSPAEAMSLPVGSLLSWRSQSDQDKRALYMRSNASTNQAGTVLVATTDESTKRAYRSSMVVVGLRTDDEPVRGDYILSLTIDSEAWDLLPPGTRFTTTAQTAPVYLIAHDRRLTEVRNDGIIPTTGRWSPQDFGADTNFFIRSIPGVTL